MWSAEIHSKNINDGVITVTFLLSDSETSRTATRVHRLSNTPPVEWVEKTAAAEVAKLEAVDAAFDAITIGTVGDPTPETVDERDFRIFYRKYRALIQLHPILLVRPELQDTQTVQDLITDVVQGLTVYWSRVVE